MLTAFSFAAVLTTSFSAVGVANAKNEQSDEISCAAKSAYVLDFDTGTVVYAKNETAHRKYDENNDGVDYPGRR